MSYSIETKGLLDAAGASEGCTVTVSTGGQIFTGKVMPHHEFSAPDIIVLKMRSGYNVGVRVGPDSKVEVVERPNVVEKEDSPVETKEGLPTLVLLGTGGTIASYVDYRTGAVHPALSTSDMINAIPEIRDIANVRAKVLFSIFSEDMDVHNWQQIAECVVEELRGGADGVIIPHGTDTMGYTAAALSFMLGDVPKPVVLVGAQRSSDRPSSDASTNLLACARFCTQAKRAGVFVIMHDTPGDDSFAVHNGARVRKMHTSRRDAFQSINAPPVAQMDREGNIRFNVECRPVSDGDVTLRSAMEKDVVLLQFYPGMDPAIFEGILTGSKGVVLSGTGLGHVNSNMIPLLKRAIDGGTVVIMTSQCLNGRVNMNVYNTGRDLLNIGIIPVYDMLPEVAYIKLKWVLANAKDPAEVRRLMTTPLAGEMGDRRVH